MDREFEGIAAFGKAAKGQIHVDIQRIDVLVGCQCIGKDGLGADVLGAFDRGHDLLDGIGTVYRAPQGEYLALFQRAAGQACPRDGAGDVVGSELQVHVPFLYIRTVLKRVTCVYVVPV